MGRQHSGKSDRQRVIDWLKEDVEYYKDNIGEVRIHGRTIRGLMSKTTVTQKLIDTVSERINQLEELEKKENVNKWRLPEFA